MYLMVVNNWVIISISHYLEILKNIVVSLVINQMFLLFRLVLLVNIFWEENFMSNIYLSYV